MPWVRVGDNAATYPKLMQIAGFPGADQRTINEVRGWLDACAWQSGLHTTDYSIDPGTAQMFGGSRTKKIVEWCVRAELLTPVDRDGVTHWLIIDDPDFINIRTRAELDWEKQRRDDRNNHGITVPVRLRDGDQCRWCGVKVEWRGRGSHKSAELDHLQPGVPATIATLVVACRRCNGSRQDNPQWDDDHQLRPPPPSPLYGPITANFLTENGYPTEPTAAHATRQASSADTADASASRPAARPRTTQNRSEARQVTAAPAEEVAPEVGPNGVTGSFETGSAGSGRAGPGPGPGPETKVRRRRGRRGAGPTPAPTTAQPCCAQPFPHTDEDGISLCLTCGTQEPR